MSVCVCVFVGCWSAMETWVCACLFADQQWRHGCVLVGCWVALMLDTSLLQSCVTLARWVLCMPCSLWGSRQVLQASSSICICPLWTSSTTWSTGKSPFPPAQISIVARKASLFQEGYGNNFLYDPLFQGLPAFYSDEAMNKIPKIGMVLEGWLQTCLLLLKALNKAILCCLSVAMKLLYLCFGCKQLFKDKLMLFKAFWKASDRCWRLVWKDSSCIWAPTCQK